VNTNPAPSLESAHLSDETLAVLAERGAHGPHDERSLQHLARCRSCLAAYADAVRYRTAWLAAPELFLVPGARVVTPRRAAPAWTPRRLAPVLAAAGLLIVVGIGAPLMNRRGAPAPAADGPIATLLERASATDLVYPGGERGAAEQPLRYREAGLEDRATADAIDELRRRYEADGARHLADLYSLSAALTAAGRTDLAHDYVQEGRALAPEHTGFLLLAAVLAHRTGNVERADQLLRQARAIAPHDVTLMLDHAILLQQSGGGAEADALLRQVIRRARGSALATRAERLLAE
jgi:hypothetical protein